MFFTEQQLRSFLTFMSSFNKEFCLFAKETTYVDFGNIDKTSISTGNCRYSHDYVHIFEQCGFEIVWDKHFKKIKQCVKDDGETVFLVAKPNICAALTN